MDAARSLILVITLIGLCVVGCDQEKAVSPTGGTAALDQEANVDQEISRLEESVRPIATDAQPSPLVTVTLGSDALQFWPYTGRDYSGEPSDPINLIFYGEADPRDIRAALLSLDGDRTALGLPPVSPFNSVWTDAIGEIQITYGGQSGWSGGVIQLSCGDYEAARFHLRLFKLGRWTVAGAHFEVLIPGTSDHQVISWELAEQFVMGDFVRSGLLDETIPLIPIGSINESPFRTIPAVIYNGIPEDLKALIGGPAGEVTADVPIWTDGSAVILNLENKIPPQAEVRRQDFIINYGQIVPKPFCSSGPMDYVFVEGPVFLSQTVRMTQSGIYRMYFSARGTLTVTPVDPLTGEPTAEPFTAHVRERYTGKMNDRFASASSLQFQKLVPEDVLGAGQLFRLLSWNTRGQNGFFEDISCVSSDWLASATETPRETQVRLRSLTDFE